MLCIFFKDQHGRSQGKDTPSALWALPTEEAGRDGIRANRRNRSASQVRICFFFSGQPNVYLVDLCHSRGFLLCKLSLDGVILYLSFSCITGNVSVMFDPSLLVLFPSDCLTSSSSAALSTCARCRRARTKWGRCLSTKSKTRKANWRRLNKRSVFFLSILRDGSIASWLLALTTSWSISLFLLFPYSSQLHAKFESLKKTHAEEKRKLEERRRNLVGRHAERWCWMWISKILSDFRLCKTFWVIAFLYLSSFVLFFSLLPFFLKIKTKKESMLLVHVGITVIIQPEVWSTSLSAPWCSGQVQLMVQRMILFHAFSLPAAGSWADQRKDCHKAKTRLTSVIDMVKVPDKHDGFRLSSLFVVYYHAQDEEISTFNKHKAEVQATQAQAARELAQHSVGSPGDASSRRRGK